MTILTATNLSKSFSDPKPFRVLANVSLSLKKGESAAICGRSGEGKTTLLHILGTLEPPDEGDLVIAGVKATPACAHELRRRHIGFVFQSFNLLEEFTALDNVLMPASIARKNTRRQSDAYARALHLLEEVDLADKAQTPAKLLSGGERQRVAIARALCNDPDLILADEPSGNLDRNNALRIGELLLRCTHAHQKGLIVVTHDEELSRLCQTVYHLENGTLHLQ